MKEQGCFWRSRPVRAFASLRRSIRCGVKYGGVALLLVGALSIGAAAADTDTGSVSRADFDQSGLESEVLASFVAAGSQTLYSAPDSRWGSSGTLLGGDVGLDESSNIARVMVPRRDGSLLRLNDGGPLVLREYFGASGAGADLTVWVLSAAGTASFAAADVKSVGSNYVNFNVPETEREVLRSIGSADAFVLALTRPAPEPELIPEPEPEPELVPEIELVPEPELVPEVGLRSDAVSDDAVGQTQQDVVAASPHPLSVSLRVAHSDTGQKWFYSGHGRDVTATVDGMLDDLDAEGFFLNPAQLGYTYRFSVVDGEGAAVDACEGDGMGSDRQLIDDPIAWQIGLIASSIDLRAAVAETCPAGRHILTASVSDSLGSVLTTANAKLDVRAKFSGRQSTTPSLSALSLSTVDGTPVAFNETFEGTTLSYTASYAPKPYNWLRFSWTSTDGSFAYLVQTKSPQDWANTFSSGDISTCHPGGSGTNNPGSLTSVANNWYRAFNDASNSNSSVTIGRAGNSFGTGNPGTTSSYGGHTLPYSGDFYILVTDQALTYKFSRTGHNRCADTAYTRNSGFAILPTDATITWYAIDVN